MKHTLRVNKLAFILQRDKSHELMLMGRKNLHKWLSNNITLNIKFSIIVHCMCMCILDMNITPYFKDQFFLLTS